MHAFAFAHTNTHITVKLTTPLCIMINNFKLSQNSFLLGHFDNKTLILMVTIEDKVTDQFHTLSV